MILVVEDNKGSRDLLVEFLRGHEFNTIGVQDGFEALHLMKSTIPFLVILDLHMPLKSGLEVLTEMKNDSKLKDTAVIFYTGDSDPVLREDALKAGALKVMVKGNDWQELVEIIADLTSVRPELYQT